MKLTEAAFLARPEGERCRVGSRCNVARRHPFHGRVVIEHVELVEHLRPEDCEHDRIRVDRAGIFERRWLARCEDCGVKGPVVDGHPNGLYVAKLARAAFFGQHPRAGYRHVVDIEGHKLGWAERTGPAWMAYTAERFYLGLYDNADDAVRAVFSYWRRDSQGRPLPRVGCVHCGADPLDVVDLCAGCDQPVCADCRAVAPLPVCGKVGAA